MADHPIHFDGDWTDAEQRIVRRAIAEAETRHAALPASGPAGKPWICYCKRLPAMAVFVVHRLGWEWVIYARDIADLAQKIEHHNPEKGPSDSSLFDLL